MCTLRVHIRDQYPPKYLWDQHAGMKEKQNTTKGTKKHNIHQNVYRKNKPKRRNDTAHSQGANMWYTK
jgi:hypothetical protein